MHLSASIGTGKAPMDMTVLRIALSRQGHDVLPQMIEALDALRQTAAFKNADLDLRHIEPTAMFGRIMHLQSLPDALRFLWRKRLVEAGRRMGVKVVHHQADHARLRIDLIDQPVHRLSKIQPGALLGHFDTAASGQRFDEHKQVRRPQALVLTVRALRVAWLHRQRLTDLSMHCQRLFVKTDLRSGWIIWLGIQVQDFLHSPQKIHIDEGNAPLLMLPGLQCVFLNNWRTVSAEMSRTYPNSAPVTTCIPTNA